MLRGISEDRNYEMKHLKFMFVSSMFFFHSIHAVALAEENVTLKYNEIALVRLEQSLEGCNFKSPCVEFLQNDAILNDPPRRFEYIGLFESISSPVNNTNILLAKSVSNEAAWIVYDLKSHHTVFETNDIALANDKYESITHSKAIIINAAELENRLERSWKGNLLDFYDYIKISWLLIVVLSPFILVIIAVIAFSLFINRRSKKSRKK